MKLEIGGPEPDLCTFTSSDGLNVPCFYYEKDNSKNNPDVIWVHGGPVSQTRAEYNPAIQDLVELEFAVVAPNVREACGGVIVRT